MKKGAARTRLQIEFTDEALARVERIRERTDARSTGDAVRNAIRLYEWLLKQQDEGFRIQLTDGNVVRQIKFMFG